MISHLNTTLSESVSRTDYGFLENKLNMFISKTKLLLERERDWIEQKVSRDGELNIISSQSQQIYDLKLKLAELQSNSEKNQELLIQSAVPSNETKWKQHAAKLEVQIEILSLRAKMAEERVVTAHASESLIRKQLDDADRMYMNSKQETIALQQDFLELCNNYEVLPLLS